MSNAAAHEARAYAERSWKLNRQYTKLDAELTGWEQSTAADGSPLLTVRISGPDQEKALLAFTNGTSVVLDTRTPHQWPAVDFSVEGRVVCLWRTGGVWVEMWHPEAAAPLSPSPALLADLPRPTGRQGAVRRLASRPSARLPFGWRSRASASTKEKG
ncbi:hypothetical protein ACF06X_33665 [Streptomyces sp. NPDC015346]|uniref:hypothetical protein n=1 Tax=Streptomyces sp. NPDC015346 TaxID=3364954 RepID=UPI0036F55DB9